MTPQPLGSIYPTAPKQYYPTAHGQYLSQTDKQTATKLTKFRQYIENNIEMIVNYQERLDNNQIFTSSFAESTVESLINQRCKGKKHMRWTREGLNNILQIRAAIASNSWNNIWKMVVRNSIANTTIN